MSRLGIPRRDGRGGACAVYGAAGTGWGHPWHQRRGGGWRGHVRDDPLGSRWARSTTGAARDRRRLHRRGRHDGQLYRGVESHYRSVVGAGRRVRQGRGGLGGAAQRSSRGCGRVLVRRRDNDELHRAVGWNFVVGARRWPQRSGQLPGRGALGKPAGRRLLPECGRDSRPRGGPLERDCLVAFGQRADELSQRPHRAAEWRRRDGESLRRSRALERCHLAADRPQFDDCVRILAGAGLRGSCRVGIRPLVGGRYIHPT